MTCAHAVMDGARASPWVLVGRRAQRHITARAGARRGV